ncbi:13446_t:CDS:2 [Acaulospora colombiana]|uniref:13446_t:CDS:1 n=1 Tax=Acaulospora colombiana TaxID=27376 RepID=A0ACA9KMF1_9GLOM|nr:13446_t:CDS:2 [Acaulospora colombiana]
MYQLKPMNIQLRILIVLILFLTSQTSSYALPLQYDTSFQQLFTKSRMICVHTNLTSSYMPISGRFYNLPEDDNPKNYHLYLLHPDNSMRRDLSWIFSRGLRIGKDANGVARDATLELVFRSVEFPLQGVNSYVGGWIKVYHIRDSIVTAAGPAQINLRDEIVV